MTSDVRMRFHPVPVIVFLLLMFAAMAAAA